MKAKTATKTKTKAAPKPAAKKIVTKSAAWSPAVVAAPAVIKGTEPKRINMALQGVARTVLSAGALWTNSLKMAA